MLLRKEHIDGDGLIGIGKITDNHQALLLSLPQSQQRAAEEYV